MRISVMRNLAAIAAFTLGPYAYAQDLTGDTRLACEALLCMASGTRPGQCAPSINRYFSIRNKNPTKTMRERLNFLQMCPSSSQTAEMQSLVTAMVNGAGNCDPSALNSALQVTRIDQYGQPYSIISNQMPAYCTAYTGHVYTYFEGTIPKYVGLPERGGYWVDPQSYDQALAGYNQRIAQENEAARLNLYLSNMGN